MIKINKLQNCSFYSHWKYYILKSKITLKSSFYMKGATMDKVKLWEVTNADSITNKLVGNTIIFKATESQIIDHIAERNKYFKENNIGLISGYSRLLVLDLTDSGRLKEYDDAE